ncbi:tetratricopeptide repeat protein [Candidatus Peribacteria bacterium]|nr:MAG: tetratricopeptide repeat protein [Candidatus Peribacteria bacterium]
MSRSQIIGTILGFFFVTFAIYGLSLGNNFVAWDDNYLIISNAIIKGFSWEHTVSAFTSFDPELYDPLIFLVYQFNYMIGGIDPFMYHFTNLVLHTLNALGVCVVLSMLTKKRWIGILGGLVFAVHPLNTEAVSWASALKDVLSTFFFLASLIVYLQYRKNGDRKWMLYAVSIILFLLGLLSKVMVLTLPAVLILMDLYENRQWSKRMIHEKIPYAVLSIIFGIVALLGKQDIVTQSTIVEKMLMAAKSTIFYVWSYLWPDRLSVLYPYSKPIILASPDFFVPVLLVTAMIGIMILTFKKARPISVGIAFYLITLFPTFFNFAKGNYFYVASDRYAYIPQIGLLLALFFVVDRLLERQTARYRQEYIYTGVGIILLILSVLAMRQSLVWKNTETLFLQTLKYHPDAQAARLNLGYVYRESKMYDKALEQFDIVLRREPDSALAFANMGLVYEKQGRIDDAISVYQQGISAKPRERDSYMSLGMLYERLEKLDEALALYIKVTEINPVYAPVYANMGSVYVQKNDLTAAQAAYEKAVSINPHYADAHFNLAYIHTKNGRLAEAAAEYETTLAIEGDTIETLQTLTGIYAEQNKVDDTVRTLQRILAIDPANTFATQLLQAIESQNR